MTRKCADPETCEIHGRLPRTPDGDINNCAIANGDEEKNCQMCLGTCPDRDRFGAKPKTQDQIDADRAAMADEIVRAQNLTNLEDAKQFAKNWIMTAAQHAENEKFYRVRSARGAEDERERLASLLDERTKLLAPDDQHATARVVAAEIAQWIRDGGNP